MSNKMGDAAYWGSQPEDNPYFSGNSLHPQLINNKHGDQSKNVVVYDQASNSSLR